MEIATTAASHTPIATLTFLRRELLGDGIIGHWFHPEPALNHIPGQFVEVTLPHGHPDSRGIRREFTIASSPTEPGILIASRFTDPSSSFKRQFRQLQTGERLNVTYFGGDFTLPDDLTQPLLLIAGGIGVTPFRSMLKYLIDRDERRDSILIYGVSEPDQLIFADVLQAAEKQGVQIVRMVTNAQPAWVGDRGPLETTHIVDLVPDASRREIYVSGPEPLVSKLTRDLAAAGIPADQLHRDEFPGYRTID